MQCQSLSEFVHILQTAIGPALLISGTGLLILSMINRLNHLTDRARRLVEQLDPPQSEAHRSRAAQVTILWKRARILRLAIVLAVSSTLFDAILIASLFLSRLLGNEEAWEWIGLLFIFAMGTLILSLLFFIGDINHSLRALALELETQRREIEPT